MGALDGLKILDFSTLLPGPYASLILADLGAEVLKVSSASKPDLVINYEPFIGDSGISACQAWLGRNKKAMFLNLKTPEAREITATLSSDEFRFHISSADHTSSATQHLPSSVCTPIHAHADLCEIP